MSKGKKQQVPHVAEESKCIDAANCQDCKTYRQSQETGVLAAKAKLFEMPVTKWQNEEDIFLLLSKIEKRTQQNS